MTSQPQRYSRYAQSAIWVQRVVFTLTLLAIAVILYRYALSNIIDGDRLFRSFIIVWVLTTYFLLPRIHRYLTKLYLPDYYIGRVRTADGLLGDPINLAVIGSANELKRAMEHAGWASADPITIRTSLRLIKASILKESYPAAPVSRLYLFNRKQEFAFQKEVNNNPRQRHHVRFWATPKDWWLPGGYQADWLGSGTYDKNVGLSLFNGQLTHRIAADVDSERDYIVADLQQADVINELDYVAHYSTGFHSRNGGGDRITTDGALPFINLKSK